MVQNCGTAQRGDNRRARGKATVPTTADLRPGEGGWVAGKETSRENKDQAVAFDYDVRCSTSCFGKSHVSASRSGQPDPGRINVCSWSCGGSRG